MPALPPHYAIAQHVSSALLEDIGTCDWTANLIDSNNIAKASVFVREPAILCGQAWFDECFRQVNPAVSLCWNQPEGTHIQADTLVCELMGPAPALLMAERSALNFLQLLSAVATETHRYVEAVRGTRARIVDTRKTFPGLRIAQKYAVTIGGGHNQRIGLFDGILIKENHILAAGSINEAVERARCTAPSSLSLQVEVETLDELDEALATGVNLILLDNMPLTIIYEAVKRTAGRACLEASGGVNLTTVRQLAESGVDRISVGKLTKDVCAIDFSMRFL